MKRLDFDLSSNYYLVTWVLIPFLLAMVWIGFSLFFTSKYSLTVIASPHERSEFTSFKTSELLAKQKISAQFQANEDNLGIVSVRFYNFQRISNDSVIFRIKEKNQKGWFYESTYKVNQFQPDELFPFGFPTISESKDKSYFFEIESVKGKNGDAIGMSSVYPAFVTQYQFPKEQIIEKVGSLVEFVFVKLYYSFADRNFFIASLVFLLPLVFYVVWCFFAQAIIRIRSNPQSIFNVKSEHVPTTSVKYGYILVYIYFFILLLLIFLMDEENIYASMLLFGLWIWLIRLYRFDSSVTYFFSLFFLLLSPVMLILNQNDIAQRSAIWVYFFLVIGTVTAVLEGRKKNKTKVTYDTFIKQNIVILRKLFKRN